MKTSGMASPKTSSVYSFSKYTEEPTAYNRRLPQPLQYKYRDQASVDVLFDTQGTETGFTSTAGVAALLVTVTSTARDEINITLILKDDIFLWVKHGSMGAFNN